jgi:L,D-transpeptidase ErfK/SrfK
MNPARCRFRRVAAGGAWIFALVLLAVLAVAGTGCRHRRGPVQAEPADRQESSMNTEALRADVVRLRKQNELLRTGLDKLTPKEPFIVINTTLNRLYVRQGSQVLIDAVCSTGSNTQLVEPSGKRRWFFSTPKGVFSVKNKMIAPVWVKPDWAFIEEGEPVPGKQAAERFEEGFLGRYGLYFGNGYLIHGTLFQRFLGQSVTHGCVRLGDADLEKVYEKAKVGTKIFIY